VRLVAKHLRPAASLGVGGGARAQLLAELRDDRSVERLLDAGISARTVAPRIATLTLSDEELARIVETPTLSRELLSIEGRRWLRPTLDRAASVIGAPTARAQLGVEGRGVLVAVVDTGVDPLHADLRDATGRTRIELLADIGQPDDGRHPELGALPARVWTRAELDDALASNLAPSTDRSGHGTHVASIAVGTGHATANGLPAGRYVGIAPEAALLALKATRTIDAFLDVDVLSLCRLAVDTADRLQQPLVVNLSLGGPGGPNDGSSLVERALDALLPANAPGRALVVAAGNDGSVELRASGAWSHGELRLPFELRASPRSKGSLSIALYYDRGAPAISVEDPAGRSSAAARPGEVVDGEEGPYGRVQLAHEGPPASGAGRGRVALVVTPRAAGQEGGATWTVRLTGPVAGWDATLTEWPASGPRPRFLAYQTREGLLNVPATAQAAIVVGSHSVRGDWTHPDGSAERRALDVGVPSSFSGTGPSADGRFLPDLTAPGEVILAALSSSALPTSAQSAFYVPSDATYAIGDDGLHAALIGSSQAAPFVAGALALLFERRPSLTSAQARELLRVTTEPPARDGSAHGGWTPAGGFGLLRVDRALALLEAPTSTAPADPTRSTVATARTLLSPSGDRESRVTVIPRDASGQPLGPGRRVRLATSAGRLVGEVEDLGSGRYEQRLAPADFAGEVAVLSAWVDGVLLDEHPAVWFADDWASTGPRSYAGGGCALGGVGTRAQALSSPEAPQPLVALLILVLLLLALLPLAQPRVGARAWSQRGAAAPTRDE
jgi:subtilisin family serine protease